MRISSNGNNTWCHPPKSSGSTVVVVYSSDNQPQQNQILCYICRYFLFFYSRFQTWHCKFYLDVCNGTRHNFSNFIQPWNLKEMLFCTLFQSFFSSSCSVMNQELYRIKLLSCKPVIVSFHCVLNLWLVLKRWSLSSTGMCLLQRWVFCVFPVLPLQLILLVSFSHCGYSAAVGNLWFIYFIP